MKRTWSLWDIEPRQKGEVPKAALTSGKKREEVIRQEQAKPILDEFKGWL
jgi:hypothetical protein